MQRLPSKTFWAVLSKVLHGPVTDKPVGFFATIVVTVARALFRDTKLSETQIIRFIDQAEPFMAVLAKTASGEVDKIKPGMTLDDIRAVIRVPEVVLGIFGNEWMIRITGMADVAYNVHEDAVVNYPPNGSNPSRKVLTIDLTNHVAKIYMDLVAKV